MAFLILLLLFSAPNLLSAQQVADTSYNPDIRTITYPRGAGPTVFIDQGHHNFHTKDGRYQAFARLLQRDGYRVLGYEGAFERNKLDQAKILVISNALNQMNTGRWFLPNPSAFTADEIQVIREWVQDGGSLFLIADHMPMAGAAQDLAGAFGFEFTNGFVIDTNNRGPAHFTLTDSTLVESIITRGKSAGEQVDEIVSFTGQGFKVPDDATPVLIFGDNFVNLLPDTAWVFESDTPTYNVAGWSQGAFRKFGSGRVVVFGEAAMFSAQLGGPHQVKMGMNSPAASQNYQLLLNIFHWLDGLLE